MHHIRSDVRRAAWNDKSNPFTRYRPPGAQRRRHESGLFNVTANNGDFEMEGDMPAPEGRHPQSASDPEIARRTDSGTVDGIQKATSEDDLHDQNAEKSAMAMANQDAVESAVVTTDQESENGSGQGKKIHHAKFTLLSQLRAIFGSWVNLLLVFVPAGFAVNYANASASTVFAINFIGIVPNMVMIAFAVEEIMMRVGEKLGGLLSITFSNATQLISSILLLRSQQIVVLKNSLIGSIISNLLFMPGLCFLAGGYNRMEQAFNVTLIQTISMMLLLAIFSLLVPTASRFIEGNSDAKNLASQSRGTAIIVLVSYGLYLFFQLKTHVDMFVAPSVKNQSRFTQEQKAKWKKRAGVEKLKSLTKAHHAHEDVTVRSVQHDYEDSEEDDGEVEQPQLSFITAVVTLIIATVLIAFNAEFATNSVQTMTQESHLSQIFVGFVIFPILSNDPDCVLQAIKDKMDMSLALTLEKCMQTALMVIPLLVILAWCLSIDEMTLDFDGFSVAALSASVVIVSYVIQDGRSNWLIGALLVKIYVIIALAAYFIH